MSSNHQVPDPEVPAKARSRTYSAAYKARVLAEYESLDKAGKGALLRREGLYTSLISTWRQQRDQGALQALGTTPSTGTRVSPGTPHAASTMDTLRRYAPPAPTF